MLILQTGYCNNSCYILFLSNAEWNGKERQEWNYEIDTLVADFPDIYRLIKQDEVFKTYSFPKSYVSYQKPRPVSAKQKEWAGQMMIERNRAKEN